MTHKIAIALVFALLLIGKPSAAARLEAGTDEGRAGMCADYSGLAFGFCVALCEARQCDLQSSDDERCSILRSGFDRATGGLAPPC